MPVDTRLVLTILAVKDLALSLQFYRSAFGWPQLVDVPVYAEFELPNGQRLGLYQREAFGANTGRVPFNLPQDELAPTELYFYTGDIAAALGNLESAGATLLSPLAARVWGDEVAYYADPDGNVLAIARPGLN